jgi:hypothetical protein
MAIYVDTDVVQKELEKLQARLKERPSITPLTLDLEISLTYQAVLLAADDGVRKVAS